jgi:hypothetical protein
MFRRDAEERDVYKDAARRRRGEGFLNATDCAIT